MADSNTRLENVATTKGLVGKELPPGPWHRMTFEDIVKFADLTGDHQWVHVDKARAVKESPFGAPVAHGYFTLALVGGLFRDVVDPGGFKMGVNYGLNKVRFPAPMKEGAEFRLKMKVDSVKDIDNGVEVVFLSTIELKDSPKPACVAECVYRFYA